VYLVRAGQFVLQISFDSHLEVRARATGSGLAGVVAIPGIVAPESHHHHHDNGEEMAALSTAFGSQPITARLLCASSLLWDVLELEHIPGVSRITLEFVKAGGDEHQDDDDTASRSTRTTTTIAAAAAAGTPSLSMTVQGHSSQCQVVLPGPIEFLSTTTNNRNNHHHNHRQRRRRIRYSYPISAWQRAMNKSLLQDLATETCVSVNSAGILAIQHQIVLPSKGLKEDTTHGGRRNHHHHHQQQQQQQHAVQPFGNSLLLQSK
jgi:hypothetical protein